jgi:hypothetical protein
MGGNLVAYTPHFNTADDGGWWGGDYGERICQWTYDTESNEISVTCGEMGKRHQLPAKPGGIPLKHHLASIAIQLAAKITGKDYDV